MESEQREPLSELETKNVATVRPMSRLPMMKSKIPTPGSKLKNSTVSLTGASDATSESTNSSKATTSKRKSDVDHNVKGDSKPAAKRMRLNMSTSSDPGTLDDAPIPKMQPLTSSKSRPPSGKTGPPSRPGLKTNASKAAPVTKRGPGMRRSQSTSSLHKSLSEAAAPVSSRAGVSRPRGPPPSAKKPATATIPKAAPAKKRPAWDVKGRLQDMEAERSAELNRNMQLMSQVNTSNERLSAVEELVSSLKTSLSHGGEQISDLEGKLRQTKRDLEETEHELAEERRTFDRRVQDLEFERSTLARQKTTLEAELTVTREECTGIKSTLNSVVAAQAGLKAEFDVTKLLLEKTQAENSSQKQDIESMNELNKKLEEKLRTYEEERRKMHNIIQELKGNIRVFCRVRPLLGEELLGSNGELQHLHFPDHDGDKKCLELEKLADINPNESLAASLRRGSNNRYEFTFDKVFDPLSKQVEVFDEISQLVQSALDGYHVCIFAYGQTGSGKTYTMEGPIEPDPDSQGMIPRAVEQVFSSAAGLEDKGWQYEFELSFLEIYNETIRDLLGNDENMKHDIKMVSANSSEVMVTNLTKVKVTQPNQVHRWLRKAGENRAVAETRCNQRSSRSHSVFQMKITGKNTVTEETCVGLLNLIDLAGSERLKESGSQGQRLKETQSINGSLSNLGNVIMALAKKDQHIPYRNSKLTHLLQHCLGGNSKVLMFVNVSPKESCVGETLNSLRFATKVNNCNIGTAQKKSK